MQPRQYRPGDVLDDYCPRERRITDHAIVAMVEDDIQRTRCVVCDAEHEFKNARVPAPRKKTATAALFNQVLDTMDAPARRVVAAAQAETPQSEASQASTASPVDADAAPVEMAAAADVEPESPPPAAEPAPPAETEERPFRRSLIRATLPRPEGQPPPTRAIPEFTMHQPLNQRGRRPGGGQGRFRRRPGGAPDNGGPMRFGPDAGHGNGNGAGHGGRRRRRKKQH